MKKTLFLCAILLLTTSAAVRAEEAAGGPSPASPSAAEAPVAAAVIDLTAPTPAPAGIPTPAQPGSQPAAPAAAATPQNEPQPYTGWVHGVRAPVYLNLMLSVGALTEDGSNRLTTRDSKVLEGFGGLLRVGAVIGEHHRVGARMQSFVRPTKKILLDSPAVTPTTNDWGAVTFGFVGPEYLYGTDFGLYFGGSVGIGAAMSSTRIEKDDEKDHIERGSAGVAGILSVGYEWRANKWFAMNAEVYGGLYHGLDDNENSMNAALFGFGIGVGF